MKNCHWPELSLYCGCCTLSTGIYIRSVVIIAVTIVIIGINAWILDFLLHIRQQVYNNDMSVIEEIWDTQTNLQTIYRIYNALVVYYILWISYKAVYILIVLWTIYAVYRKHTKIIKILVYISIPGLILDLIISVAGSCVLDLEVKIVLFICILSEGYNVLAMHSQYKKITGKSRLATDNGISQSNTQQYPNNCINQNGDLRFRPGYNAHCRTCTCYEIVYENPPEYSINEVNNTQTPGIDHNVAVNNNNNNSPITIVNNRPTTSQAILELPTSDTEVLTMNDEIEMQIIENRDYTNDTGLSLNANTSNGHGVRPTTLNIGRSNRAKDTKIELSDHPVIYDESQLDVGTSPVIEDRLLCNN
ncbi:uncharacterized protein LOC112055532 isoform X2 [Bicyclus anynana]|nr:uncharacterized protein LOC112055532 isoform X2 [Bicyclus anynana]